MQPLESWRMWQHRVSTRFYRPHPGTVWLSWIGQERIAVGGLPTGRSVLLLGGQGITHVVNCRARAQTWLTQDLAVERRMFGSSRVAHAPMWDLGQRQPPRLWSSAARFAADALDTEPAARVFVHCQQGRRRSVLLAYAVLRLRGHRADDAAALILTHRVGAQLVPAYRDSVEQWLSDGAVRT